MNGYTVIDENRWRRREHCAIFRHYVEPSYCMTVDLDVTNFLRTVRNEGYSFTMSFIWVVSKCANEIEEFRYRFLSERVVLFDKIDTSFAYMDEGDDLFKMVTVPFRDSMREYVQEATRAARAQKVYFPSPRASMCSSSPRSHGCPTVTYPIRTPDIGTTSRRCSTGGDTRRGMARSRCRSPCRRITRSSTAYTSAD